MKHWKSSALRLGIVGGFLMLTAAPAASIPDADPERAWIRQFGTSAIEDANDVASGGSGTYVAGSTTGSFPDVTNAGAEDAFVRKYDTTGAVVWTRQFGTAANDVVEAVTVTKSGVYLAGRTEGQFTDQPASGDDDAFVARFDIAGNLLWIRQFGTTGEDRAMGVAVRRTGIFVGGSTAGIFQDQTSAGGTDGFLRRYDLDGNVVWTRQFGSTGTDQVEDVAVRRSGIYLAGSTTGSLRGTNAGLADAFVRRFNPDGDTVWTRQFGSPANDFAYSIAAGPIGVYVAGTTQGALPGGSSVGGQDAFLRRLSTEGKHVWTRQFGTLSSDEGAAVAVSRASVFVGGQTAGVFSGQVSSGGTDAFVRRYGPAGGIVWTYQFGTTSADSVSGVAARPSGVYAAGNTGGTFGGETAAGATDSFVTRIVSYAPDGLISKRPSSAFAGNDLYNEVGGGQTKVEEVRRGERTSFFVRAQNDGDTTDSFAVDGCESSEGFRVRYFKGADNVTQAVVEGTFALTNVKPGAAKGLRVGILVRRDANAGSAKECLIAISSVNRSSKRDVVKAVVEARA